MISQKGRGYRWKGLVGLGSTGTATFRPDGSSDEDDSGKFYGGLFDGGYDGAFNPDELDYYTPDRLEEALKTMKK